MFGFLRTGKEEEMISKVSNVNIYALYWLLTEYFLYFSTSFYQCCGLTQKAAKHNTAIHSLPLPALSWMGEKIQKEKKNRGGGGEGEV